MEPVRAALETLAARLWDERRLLMLLLYRLTVARLLLSADERRFVPDALREVDRTVELLRDEELRRDEAVRALAAEWRLAPETVTLPEIVRRSPPPYDHTFGEHLAAFQQLAEEIETISQHNRVLAHAAMQDLSETIGQLTGDHAGPGATYDAYGRYEAAAGGVGARLREAL